MENAAEVLRNFYPAVVQRDLTAARAFLADEMVFEGLFVTYRGAVAGLLMLFDDFVEHGIGIVVKALHVRAR